jgi:hypothetical protein
VELLAHRTGASYLRRRGLKSHDRHSQAGNDPGHSTHGAHVDERLPPTEDEAALEKASKKGSEEDSEVGHTHFIDENALAQILGTLSRLGRAPERKLTATVSQALRSSNLVLSSIRSSLDLPLRSTRPSRRCSSF